MTKVQDMVRKVGPSVVGLGSGARTGSGVVVAPDRVLTLARRLRGDEVEVVLRDGSEVPGRLLAVDPDLDLALLEAQTGDAPAIAWAPDGPAPEIGAQVFALADPGGSGLRATVGAISGLPTRLRGRRGRPVDGVLEHTANLPSGSGGGPLVDPQGRVIGINALREPAGFILALPAAQVRPRVEALLEGRAAEPRRLGLAIVPSRAARRLRRSVGLEDRDGLLVRAVADQSPAAQAGVRRGDLITAFGGRALTGIDDLYAALDAAPLGRPVPLAVLRGAEERELAVTFADGEPRGRAGAGAEAGGEPEPDAERDA
jgi:serine protease Do